MSAHLLRRGLWEGLVMSSLGRLVTAQNLQRVHHFFRILTLTSYSDLILEYSQSVWDPYTTSDTQQLESLYMLGSTIHSHCRTSGVGTVLAELKWEIHYRSVADNMPLELKYS